MTKQNSPGIENGPKKDLSPMYSNALPDSATCSYCSCGEQGRVAARIDRLLACVSGAWTV